MLGLGDREHSEAHVHAEHGAARLAQPRQRGAASRAEVEDDARVARLAFGHRITGYDACYAALAFELDGKWLTFDRAAHARVEALGICAVPTAKKLG